MNDSESGSIQVKDEVIIYTSDSYGAWELAVSEVVLIGEYTNQNGPFADDYFITFISNSNGRYFEAPFYCDGRDDLLDFLAEYFGHKFEYMLCNSTDFKSRIMWPPELENKPMFDYKEEGFFKPRVIQNISEEIINKLTNHLK